MALTVVSLILINWLLTAAWIVDRRFALWAAVAAFLWWLAGLNRKPLWPAPSRRGLMYGLAVMWFMAVAFVIDVPLAWLVPLEILILFIFETRMRSARTT